MVRILSFKKILFQFLNQFSSIVKSNECNAVYYTVSENSKKIYLDISREDSTLDLEAFEVLVTSAPSAHSDIETYSKYHKNKQLNEIFQSYHSRLLYQDKTASFKKNDFSSRNVTLAVPNEDYLAINQVLKFSKGEKTKVSCYLLL